MAARRGSRLPPKVAATRSIRFSSTPAMRRPRARPGLSFRRTSSVETPFRTANGGGAWTQVGTFVHPHGSCQILQRGGWSHLRRSQLRSSPKHRLRSHLDNAVMPHETAVIGTPKFLYTSSGVNFSPGPPAILAAPRNPGTAWSEMTLPPTLKHGAKRLAVTDDGTHHVVVQGSWMSGIWRYVEP